MGERRRGDHVGGARSDRAGAGHHAPPPMRLGEGDRGVRHGLLVMRAQRRQAITDGVERFTETGDVAVAEDRENAGEERLLVAVDLSGLRGEKTHQGLRHRQPDRAHAALPSHPCAALCCGHRACFERHPSGAPQHDGLSGMA